MSNYSSLKATINANVKQNGNQEITGAIMNSVLNAMVDSLGAGYQYKGVATPATNPGTPDYNVFYLASEAGTYTNFGGLVIGDNEVAALVYNGSWSKQTTGAATASEVSQLAQDMADLESDLEGGAEVLIPVDIGTNTNNIGYYSKNNGSLSTNSSYRYYPPVDLSEYVGKTLKMEVEWGVAPSSSYDNAICIFTANGILNSQDATAKGYVGEYALYTTRVGSKATLITTIEKPYLRISTHKNSNCTITVNVVSTSVGRVPVLEEKVAELEAKKVAPIDIKDAPFLEDFRFCTIYPNKAVSSTATIDGKNCIVWNNSATDWYTIAINIRSYKDLILVSDILPQSVISRFLTVGIDTGGANIEFVAWADSDESFSLAPTAYVFDGSKMTLTLSALLSTYGYNGNIVLYIKMPSTYKINWLASGMQLEGYDWMKIGSYAKADLKKELKADNIKIVLPSKIYAAVGHEMNLYKDSFILCDDSERYGLIASFGPLTPAHKGQNERFSFTPTVANNGVDCTIGVYDKVTLEMIATKTFKLYVKAVTQPSKKVIFIGDSLTDRCIYPAEICQELGGGNLISLGTRHDTLTYQGSNGVVSVDMDNEGRGGWSANDYCTKATDGTITNAFWNPTSQAFDFAYYMSQNGFSSVDCVVIALGTNDIGKNMLASDFDTIIGNFRTMVDSIHSYSSAIKVVISLTPHGAESDGWAAAGYSDRSTEYNYLQFTLVEKLIAEFESEANVFLAPTYLNIDHHNDYPTTEVAISARNPKTVKRQNNNVHFSVDSTTPVSQCWGYLKMADAIWYTMLAALT